jgi:hypothetical protein
MAEIPCALCGEPILEYPDDPEMVRSEEHAVAKQFYPEVIRPELRDPLWTVPSHRRCNNGVKADEEYFYHRFAPLVMASNESIRSAILQDLKRRAKKPQTRVMLRHMRNERKKVTPGGILLPSNLTWLQFDLMRIQRVAVKIVQCLFYKDHGRFVPRANFDHWEMVEEASKLQPLFTDLCQTEWKAVDPRVFCYWDDELDGCHYYAMLFWGAFMFCMSFKKRA